MKLSLEHYEDQKFVDIILTREELYDLEDYIVLAKPLRIDEEEFNFGIKLALSIKKTNNEVLDGPKTTTPNRTECEVHGMEL